MRFFKYKSNLIRIFLRCTAVFLSIYIMLIIFSLIISFLDKKTLDDNNITRLQAFNRAMSIINYKWIYEKKNISENIVLPYYIEDKNEYIGLPYCYGGHISIDTSNVKEVDNFKDALEKGYYPGNINTKLGYIKNTAGVDCSGFVAAVYNIKENISTATMNKYFKEIDYKDIKPMDIINSKGRHVYIFLGYTKDNKGIIILESTSNGDKKYKDKTVVNFKSLKEFNKDLNERKYTPMRYAGIKEGDNVQGFDSYEYNNKERFSKEITLNNKIKASIDYLEDIDYYNINIQKNTYINVSKLGKNHEIVIYNNKESIKINKKGEYELFLSGDVYIKVYASNKVLDEKDYVFELFSN